MRSRASCTPASTEPPKAAVVSARSSPSNGRACAADARPALATDRKPSAPRRLANGRASSRSGTG